MSANSERKPLNLPEVKRPDLPQTVPVTKTNPVIDSIFGVTTPAQAAALSRDSRFQDWLSARREAAEGQRTDNARMARFNALGNALTTMVQPIGWAVGGSTAGVQPYDSRQYLDAFNRAVKASEDLRNIGTLEDEYRFKMADEEYRRQLALEDEQRRREQNYEDIQRRSDAEIKKQEAIYGLRSQLNQEQIAGRIAVAEATAKAKYQFRSGNTKVSESVRDNLLKRANTAYANVLSDYYKKRGIGLENLQEPPTYDEFLKRFASENGYSLEETSQPAPKETKPSGGGAAARTSGGGRTAGFNLGGASGNGNKKGGFER